MAPLFAAASCSCASLLLSPAVNLNPNHRRVHTSVSFRSRLPLRRAALSGREIPDEWGEKSRPVPEPPSDPDPPRDDDEWGRDAAASGNSRPMVADEWGEAAELEPEEPSPADPPINDDEWGTNGAAPDEEAVGGGGEEEERREELKRCLVDTFYESELGFRASAEVRGEVVELVSQLEAANPTPAPVEAGELLDGNWILLYTSFSELLPLLAVGAIPLLKVKKVSQEIDTNNMSIVNAATILSPFASFSFSATASFEVQSPSRIQVEFKEGSFHPPEISSSLDLPQQVDIFGQKISLGPVQQLLNPIQQAFANIARSISGQPAVKLPIPGSNRARSWLLTTYLDKDLRISRGDGGLFILAKAGSPLLDQLW